jgi:FtsP/CotA-like multicopper oxidase with cupredoxin domain
MSLETRLSAAEPLRARTADLVRTILLRIAFDADNPGQWAFHCHNLYHMQTGMMTEVRYHRIAA